MKRCPKCEEQTMVSDTIDMVDYTLRVRTCKNLDCLHSYTTKETFMKDSERAVAKKILDRLQAQGSLFEQKETEE